MGNNKLNINDDSFIMIKPFMRKELNLKGNELNVYAIINGFSMDGESFFYGSWQYIADWIGADKRTVANVLKSLVKKGLLIKEDIHINNVKHCRYCTSRSRQNKNTTEEHKTISQNDEKNSVVMKNFHGGDENFSSQVMKNFHPYYYNKKESIEREGVSASPQPRSQSLDINSTSNNKKIDVFKKPTLEEIQEYIKEKSLNIDAEDFYNYYESVGWVVGKGKLQMKSWKASVSRWAKREQQFTGQNNKNNGNCNTYATENYTDF